MARYAEKPHDEHRARLSYGEELSTHAYKHGTGRATGKYLGLAPALRDRRQRPAID